MKMRDIGGSRQRKSGFTLMEVALAVIVVGIGILALFSLITIGLNSSKEAVAETQTAFFAESLFNSMRIQAVKAAQDPNYNAAWAAIASTKFTNAAPFAWQSPSAITNNSCGTVFFDSRSLRGTAVTNAPSFGFRYYLQSSLNNASLPIAQQIYRVQLQVLPGIYPALSQSQWNNEVPIRKWGDPAIFYTELPFMGNL